MSLEQMCLLRLSSTDTYVTSMIADRPSKTVNTSIRFCRAVNADQSGEQTDRLDIYIPTTSCQARSETGRRLVGAWSWSGAADAPHTTYNAFPPSTRTMVVHDHHPPAMDQQQQHTSLRKTRRTRLQYNTTDATPR